MLFASWHFLNIPISLENQIKIEMANRQNCYLRHTLVVAGKINLILKFDMSANFFNTPAVILYIDQSNAVTTEIFQK
jgi:hypothetical protein